MEYLRDPIWQFLGVVVAVLTALIPGVIWLRKRRRNRSDEDRDARIVAELSKQQVLVSRGYGKHKKRKADGILLGNLSSDFFNQFPVPVGVLAAHLDRIYTPENFGASDWVTVFRRLTAEGYFFPADGLSPKRLKVETPLGAGEKLKTWLDGAARVRSSIQGLDG